MGSKLSSLSSFNLKSSQRQLRKKLFSEVTRNLPDSVRRKSSVGRRRFKLRWLKRTRPTSPEPSVPSIRGFWRFSNRSRESVEKNDLRVVNWSRPQTPKPIDRCGKCDTLPGLADTNIVNTDVDPPASNATTPKAFQIESVPIHALIDVSSSLPASPETNLRGQTQQNEMLRHREEARFLTSTFRRFERSKSRTGECSRPVSEFQ